MTNTTAAFSVAQVRVAYGDVDKMGVVYYANYLRWFELSRGELLRDSGIPYTCIEERGLAMPVVEVNARYRRSAQYDDLLEVRSLVRSADRVRVCFEYEVWLRADGSRSGTLLTEGTTVHACTNNEGTPRRFPKDIVEALQAAPRR